MNSIHKDNMHSGTGEPAKKKPKSSIKRCFVPFCDSTSESSKLFFSVPKTTVSRQKWLDAVQEGCGNRPKSSSANSGHSCCEDHFCLDLDVDSWKKYDTTIKKTVEAVRLKPNIVPSLFPNASHRKGGDFCDDESLQQMPEASNIQKIMEAPSRCMVDASTQTDEEFDMAYTKHLKCVHIESCLSNSCTQYKERLPLSKELCSPQISVNSLSQSSTLTQENNFNPSQASSGDFIPSQSTETQSTLSDCENTDQHIWYKQCREVNDHIMSDNPKVFLGLDPQNMFVVQTLGRRLPFNDSERNTLITLRKIKLNETFTVLSKYFCVGPGQLGTIFAISLKTISNCLKELVFRPSKDVILQNLPVAFRSNFSSVTDILDCFEIEIEKPSNPVHQSLTYSEYKKCNTIKYLVASTPDGFVSFISDGYGGKMSDVALVRECGYLETLEPGMVRMTDRGFKHIDRDLEDAGCTLLRPPSVASGEILTKDESLFAKQIAALRIHIERVIGRLREFRFLQPHSCIDNHLVDLLDAAVMTAAGLINMQGKLIKC